MSWQVEIEDASLVWQDVSDLGIADVSAGNASDSQIIPQVTISFYSDHNLPANILDPETNRERARLRITAGDTVTYYRIEQQPGELLNAYARPTVTGRAYAGIVTEWPPVTFDFSIDISAADMARQICTRNVADQAGTSVSVLWLASQNPTIPGGRFQVSRQERWPLLREIAEMCGARVRVTNDGNAFEVYDMPAKALTASAERTFANPRSGSYRMQRVKQTENAVRVRGEQRDYTRPTLPVVVCAVLPDSIAADGSSTATAVAKVFDSSGQAVRHKSIVDEAITAGSFTSIPVSGCYSVQAVWLNSGTAESPTKGARVTPSSFTASSITVPDNSTQLFIVSYTQAESVSWTLADQADEIIGEAQDTTGTLAVSTTNPIGRVMGVYRATDTNRSGTNYYTGGSATANTTSITLGISPGASGTAVIIDYEEYNGTPLSASISPSSSLCDANGIAESTIGAGSTVGTAKVTATALGQEGSAWLSLTGSAIDSLTLASDKRQILVGSSVAGLSSVSETGLTVQHDTLGSGLSREGYVTVSNKVVGGTGVTVSGLDVQIVRWTNIGGTYKVYIRTLYSSQYLSIGTSSADVTYKTDAEVENTAGSATITATALQADGTAVTNGTQVDFSIISGPATLSSTRETTTGGEASVTLTAGSSTGEVRIRAVCGSQAAEVRVQVVTVITDERGTEEEGNDAGKVGRVNVQSLRDALDRLKGGERVQQDSNDADGSITGRRRLVCTEGKEKKPRANIWVYLCKNGSGNYTSKVRTDADGWFDFTCGVVGTNTGETETGETFSWTIAPGGSPSRGSGTYDPSEVD